MHGFAPHCINRVSLPGKGHPRLDHHLAHLLELLLEHLLELRLELDFADTLRVFFEEYFEAYLQHLLKFMPHTDKLHAEQVFEQSLEQVFSTSLDILT